jgi:signal transduction histidine kinase
MSIDRPSCSGGTSPKETSDGIVKSEQLLAFSRQQPQPLRVAELNPVVEGIVKTLNRLIGEDIELIFVPGKDLGKIRLDPVQIEQILMNLAANSRDAMPQGGKLTIQTSEVKLDEEYVEHKKAIIPLGRYAVLTVSDNGGGIPADHVAHVFEPFYTTKPSGRHRPGLGDGVRHCQTESWIRLGLQRTRDGNKLQNLFALRARAGKRDGSRT